MALNSTSDSHTPEQLTAEQIRSQMQQHRLEFDSDVEQFVDGTNALGNWKQYVKAKPMFALAVCAAAGYMVIPKKKDYVSADPDRIARLVRKDKLVVAPPQRVKRGSGMFAGLTQSLLRLGMQTAAGVVMQKLGEKAAPPNSETA
ncbi:hypothetical protein [Mariniblastus fucicola]|uniref:Uncharacterized protein n=1 Tax=Mariniblastus fucicola TaxID=980251 RepID=A0A5B9P1I4_9BACT|nr:hypothetical protein [Mariniblastus fucicola]QEG20377.1 hypothetical protein MFFC18_02250 [Mariniblastus fucicola]